MKLKPKSILTRASKVSWISSIRRLESDLRFVQMNLYACLLPFEQFLPPQAARKYKNLLL